MGHTVNTTQALKLTGKSRATFHRHVKAGKVSATKSDLGHNEFDIAELQRVYGKLNMAALDETDETVSKETPRDEVIHLPKLDETALEERLELERLRVKVEALEEAKAKAEESAEEWKQQANKWQAQASNLLADHRKTEEKQQSQPAPEGGLKGVWKKLFPIAFFVVVIGGALSFRILA